MIHSHNRTMNFTYMVQGQSYEGSGDGCQSPSGGAVAIVYARSDPSIVASQFDQEKLGWLPYGAIGVSAFLGLGGYLSAKQKSESAA